MLMYFYYFMYMSGLLSFSLKRKHLLLMLLSLEFIVLVLFLNLFNYLMMESMDFFFSMIFLTFSVCEGALGLSMLISMVRIHGNDYIMALSFLW
uniref:NADH-ubiquinone oxidoreductase chain 4L n=2 Tax=Coleoptera TaxID=7041 RepID=A0A346RFL9_9COLE|nr:NADH dehydrogenase subunit 4L [Coleoptera sp. 2 KM-2017]AXS66007.1 NADH dehydrogenase subunit 4L [Cucujoidea sp. 36 KM-2017]